MQLSPWGASTASLELGFVPQCDWRMICTNYETLSNSNKSWTRRPTQISSFTTFIRLTLCKFWLLQNFGTRIQNLLILYDPLWSYRLQKYYNTLAKKKMFRVSHAFQQLPGHCLRPGFVLLPVGEDWDMETSTTTVTQSASSQMSHQASWLAVSFHLTKIQTMAIFYHILGVLRAMDWDQQHLSSASRVCTFFFKKIF